MIRIVCPFCHVPLSVNELEKASMDGHACLVCPACDTVLITEDEAAPEPHEATVDA